MFISSPKFWQSKNIISNILLPFSFIYILIAGLRNFFIKPYKSSIKVICIGNLTCGGGGKTPASIAIAKLLIKEQKKIAFLSRGYGGKLKGIIKIDNSFNDASLVGDEPILLSKVAPVYVSKDKIQALKTAEKDNIEYIIMDDGLQNSNIFKDLSIIVIDGGYGFGNERILPAGPLREKITKLNKADFLILIGEDKFNLKKRFGDLNLIQGFYQARHLIDPTKSYIAFAGISRPKKFFDSLTELGVSILETLEYPDHYYYKKQDIEDLIRRAAEKNCKLITTEKDIVKVDKIFYDKINILPIELRWNDESLVTKLINKALLKFAYEEEFKGNLAYRTGVCSNAHEDSSIKLTCKLSSEENFKEV